jgi:pimeloyl-ACP methyl ester carboxylesterase
MSRSKAPTFLFIPGGWHLPDYYSPIIKSLADSGYDSETVTLNINADPPLEDLEPEVNSILSKLRPLLKAGKDVIVVSHSYGGIPTTEAVGRLMEEQSSGSNDGQVVRLVYIAAFVPVKGDSIASMIGEFDEPLNPSLIDFDVSTEVEEWTWSLSNPFAIAALFHSQQSRARITLPRRRAALSIRIGTTPW